MNSDIFRKPPQHHTHHLSLQLEQKSASTFSEKQIKKNRKWIFFTCVGPELERATRDGTSSCHRLTPSLLTICIKDRYKMMMTKQINQLHGAYEAKKVQNENRSRPQQLEQLFDFLEPTLQNCLQFRSLNP